MSKHVFLTLFTYFFHAWCCALNPRKPEYAICVKYFLNDFLNDLIKIKGAEFWFWYW